MLIAAAVIVASAVWGWMKFGSRDSTRR